MPDKIEIEWHLLAFCSKAIYCLLLICAVLSSVEDGVKECLWGSKNIIVRRREIGSAMFAVCYRKIIMNIIVSVVNPSLCLYTHTDT